MDKVKARNLIVFMNGSAIAYQKECTLTVNADTAEMANASSGEWKQYFTKRKGWKMTCNSLLPSTNTTPSAYVGRTVTLVFALSPSASSGMDADDRSIQTRLNSGTAIVTEADTSGGNSGYITWKMTFLGNGELR